MKTAALKRKSLFNALKCMPLRCKLTLETDFKANILASLEVAFISKVYGYASSFVRANPFLIACFMFVDFTAIILIEAVIEADKNISSLWIFLREPQLPAYFHIAIFVRKMINPDYSNCLKIVTNPNPILCDTYNDKLEFYRAGGNTNLPQENIQASKNPT